MSEITYEKFNDHYVFSHKPKVRVYLGEANPDDYVWDEQQQAIRSASCYHYIIATGEKVDGYPEGEIAGSASATVDYKCDHDFERRIKGIASFGNFSNGRGCEYQSKDKVSQRLAESWYFNKTLEQYDQQQEQYRIKSEAFDKKYPYLKNLMLVSGETYYVDDDGNRIEDTEGHLAKITKQLEGEV